MMRTLILLAAAIAAYAQGSNPKKTAEEYPVHGPSGVNEIGAEYMVHSFGSGDQMFVVENFLVVEVALYPPKGEPVMVDTARFGLRVNGKRTVLQPQNPAMVATTLHHRDWQSPRGVQADAGMGGIGVGLGYPRTQAPFPGGPDPNRVPPNQPRAPTGDSNTPVKETVKPEEVLAKTALPDGPHKGAVAGFLYFSWQGKVSSIKSIDLIYNDEVLKLR
jgi:hypothetical protein